MRNRMKKFFALFFFSLSMFAFDSSKIHEEDDAENSPGSNKPQVLKMERRDLDSRLWEPVEECLSECAGCMLDAMDYFYSCLRRDKNDKIKNL